MLLSALILRGLLNGHIMQPPTMPYWGVAWSSGQRRSLSLQGSAVRTPVVPFFCLEKNRKSTNCEPARRERTKRPRRSGEKRGRTGRRIRNEAYEQKEMVRLISRLNG